MVHKINVILALCFLAAPVKKRRDKVWAAKVACGFFNMNNHLQIFIDEATSEGVSFRHLIKPPHFFRNNMPVNRLCAYDRKFYV